MVFQAEFCEGIEELHNNQKITWIGDGNSFSWTLVTTANLCFKKFSLKDIKISVLTSRVNK